MSPADAAPQVCWRIVARGRVQGVGYRDACIAAARAIGVTGWVRNRFDGAVEALACGSEARLDRLRRWMQRGPPAAIVDDLTVEPLPLPQPGFDRFDRRPSG